MAFSDKARIGMWYLAPGEVLSPSHSTLMKDLVITAAKSDEFPPVLQGVVTCRVT